MKIIKLQPADFVDNLWDDGKGGFHEGRKLPYPFYVHENGDIDGKDDFWKGHAEAVIGFQKDLAVQKIDLWWEEAFADPEKAVGMYVVTAAGGGMGTHQTAIASVETLERDDPPEAAPGSYGLGKYGTGPSD